MEHQKSSDYPGGPSQGEDNSDVNQEKAVPGVLKQRGYRQVSLPIPLIERIEKYIDGHKDEGFTSTPEFIRQAIREKLNFAKT